MRFEIARTRELYEVGRRRHRRMLPPRRRRCIAAARALYSGILDVIEQRDYDVFDGRARVPTWRKLATGRAAHGADGCRSLTARSRTGRSSTLRDARSAKGSKVVRDARSRRSSGTTGNRNP